MDFRDLVDLSIGSLWRIKLRATLTIAGVVIAIATFVAMLSFAAGNQKWVTGAYNELGFLTRVNVYPKDGDDTDSTRTAALDRRALAVLNDIPGVRFAYPYVDFDVTAAVADTQVTVSARALSIDAMKIKPFSLLLGDAVFSAEDAKEAVVTPRFLEEIGIEDPDSLIGREVVLTTRVASLDSAIAGAVGDPETELAALLRTVRMDSLYDRSYQEKMVRGELSDRMSRFFEALMTRQMTVADTLTIIAVGDELEEYAIAVAPIVVPEETARRFGSAGIGLSSDPADLLTALQDGSLFKPGGTDDSRGYRRVTLDLEATASHEAVTDSVEALGYRAFSFAENLKEIQRFFVFFYVGLGVLGVIALFTAALGIVNTMVMSITERRREIGILKSLGAGEREIRLVFLAESGVIGALGAAVGILFGWVGTRIIAAVLKIFMQREEMPVFDPFALPVWLIFLALGFGILVSLLAGLYPAHRAARVDPVVALRSD